MTEEDCRRECVEELFVELGGKCVVKRLSGQEREPGEGVVPSQMSRSGVDGREEVVA